MLNYKKLLTHTAVKLGANNRSYKLMLLEAILLNFHLGILSLIKAN